MTPRYVMRLRVHFMEARYHGAGDWPPAPARVFQALVAAAGPATPLPDGSARALAWLEALPAPVIGAPPARASEPVSTFVPNNDLDALGGDPAEIGRLRVAKAQTAMLLDGAPIVTYLWSVPDPEMAEISMVAALASGLFRLGRGNDPGWAEVDLMPADRAEAAEVDAGRTLFRPGPAAGPGVNRVATPVLRCPRPGTLASLEARYHAESARFASVGAGRREEVRFSQAPRAEFLDIAYGPATVRALFDIRRTSGGAGPADEFAPQPLGRIGELTTRIRDAAADRLLRALPERAVAIERHLVGRGEGVRAEERVRLIPLPSIGHEHADHAVRRLLVEVPAGCPIDGPEVLWALAGLEIPALPGADPGTSTVLVRAEPTGMLRHYGVDAAPSRRWRSVTPMAVRGIVPGAPEAAHRVAQAVRQAGVEASLASMHVQRAPYERHGGAADAFAAGTRFAADVLWHVQVELRRAVRGPIVLGDGRFLGLGLLRPEPEPRPVLAFRVVDGLTGAPDPETLARAIRRAALARYSERWGERAPGWLHGHTPGEHVSFTWDPPRRRLLVVGPEDLPEFERLREALDELRVLRAGRAGALRVESQSITPGEDPLFAPRRVWRTVTPYAVDRHLRRADAAEAVREDVAVALRRGGYPRASITVGRIEARSGVGLRAEVDLRFEVATEGPVLLGRTRQLGGGLFEGVTTVDGGEGA